MIAGVAGSARIAPKKNEMRWNSDIESPEPLLVGKNATITRASPNRARL